MWTIIEQIFPYAIVFTMPLLITALGGLFSERSGVVNIALEGLMVFGAFASALTVYFLNDSISNNSLVLSIGLFAAVAVGMLVSLLHAFASINLNANQIISGTAINLIATALTIFLARNITGSGNIRIPSSFAPSNVPFLSDIPIIGDLFFTKTYSTTWFILLVLVVSWFILYKTKFGLRLRSCGEFPQAAEAAGVNVRRIRYSGVLISGAFGGLGGALITLTYAGEFTGTVSGLGFLALAALIFGQWRPFGVLAAAFFFGFASTIANVSQVIPELSVIPPILLKIFPYVVTLIALVLFSKSSQAPKAAGEPFDSGKR
ncbi:ABC transporter permease [Bacillus sp. EB01]|uniref:ABC transporter permease n=1 Tax=Bacillus sp. EB01 TaxID=1347086 RepID=UPI0005C5A4DB|nr:ABC transporter permease [Bacillus sp. EB01]